MNEGRIWLYVSPSVGIPLFFLAFVFAALAVHASLLNNTTWFAGYWQGSAPTVTASAAPAVVVAPAVVEETAMAAPAQ